MKPRRPIRPPSARTIETPPELPGTATRQRILEAAVSSLVEAGVARTTTLEVQRRATVSRGALLHHFPTHALLLSATVDELVRRNERTVKEVLVALDGVDDVVGQTVRALAFMTNQPAFLAEIELWATSRVDEGLRAAVASAERRAREDSDRVVRALLAPVAQQPGFEVVLAFTVEFLRGLALSSVLRRSAGRRQRLITDWARAMRILLTHWR